MSASDLCLEPVESMESIDMERPISTASLDDLESFARSEKSTRSTQPGRINALFIGDLHYHQKNLEDHKLLAAEIHRSIDAYCAEKGRLDLIVCLGDELDEHDPPADVRGACIRFLRTLRERTDMLVVLVGNHTRKNNRISRGPDHTLAELSTSQGVRMVEDPIIIEHCGIRFLAMPYMDPAAFDAIMAETGLISAHETIDFAIGHQEIRGAELRPGKKSEENSHWRLEWPPLISGHIHERSFFNNVLYVGTPMQHSLSESQQKYIYFGSFGKRGASETAWKIQTHAGPNESLERRIVTANGHLREVSMVSVPVRHAVTVHVTQLPRFMHRVRERERDYFTVTVQYDAPLQMTMSSDFAQLKLMKRIKVKKPEFTGHDQNSEKPTACTQTAHRFEDELKSVAMNTEVKNILSHIGGW